MNDRIVLVHARAPLPPHVLATIERERVARCANLAYVTHNRAGWRIAFRGQHGNEGCTDEVDYDAESTLTL